MKIVYSICFLLLFFSSSCQKAEVNHELDESEIFEALSSTRELYRVKLAEYDDMRYRALIEGDKDAANKLSCHFEFTELDSELAEFWTAVTAMNGCEGSAEIFERRGSTYAEYLVMSPLAQAEMAKIYKLNPRVKQ